MIYDDFVILSTDEVLGDLRTTNTEKIIQAFTSVYFTYNHAIKVLGLKKKGKGPAESLLGHAQATRRLADSRRSKS